MKCTWVHVHGRRHVFTQQVTQCPKGKLNRVHQLAVVAAFYVSVAAFNRFSHGAMSTGQVGIYY